MHIVFIGAGPSTTATLVNLLQELENQALSSSNMHISVIEKRHMFGAGLAYSTQKPYHLFNSRANKVGILYGDRNHFFKWMIQNRAIWHEKFPDYAQTIPKSDDFVPRGIYGLYLKAMYDKAVQGLTEKGATVHLYRGMAKKLFRIGKKGYVTLLPNNSKTPSHLEADKIILAIGNPPPAPIKKLSHHAHYISDFWQQNKTIPPHAPIFIIGTGLTAMDALLTLQAQDHHGHITLISRNGKKAKKHNTVLPRYKRCLFTLDTVKKLSPPTADDYARLLSEELRIAKKQGYNWRSVIDSLRENSQTRLQTGPLTKQVGFKTFWNMLSDSEKCHWNTHYNSWFNSLRFRLPPQSWEKLQPLFTSSQARFLKGDITDPNYPINPQAYYINCTGPNLINNPVIASLRHTGGCQVHPAGGLRADKQMRLQEQDGRFSSVFRAIGPCRKGEDFETIAMVEIVDQTAQLAQSLVQDMIKAKHYETSLCKL